MSIKKAIKKIADNLSDHDKQVRNPRQLSFKFIDKNKLIFYFKKLTEIPETQREWLAENMTAHGNMYGIFKYPSKNSQTIVILCEYYGNIIAAATIENDENVLESEPSWINTYVDPKFRNQGIGTRLIEEIKKIQPNIQGGPSTIGTLFYDKTLRDMPLNDLELKYIHRQNIAEEAEKDENQKEFVDVTTPLLFSTEKSKKPHCPKCGATNIRIIGNRGICTYCYNDWFDL